MLIHRISAERPRQAKRFLTARDVGDMAIANIREIAHTADLVITDAAREIASDLGIRIIPEGDQRPVAQASKAVEPTAFGPTTPKAKGATSSDPKPVSAEAGRPNAPLVLDDALVRAVVDAIRARWRPIQRYARQLVGPEKI